MYFSDGKVEFSVSHDPSEIILRYTAQEKILIINVENSCG